MTAIRETRAQDHAAGAAARGKRSVRAFGHRSASEVGLRRRLHPARRREGGWHVLAVLIVIVIVSYGVVNTVMVAATGQLQIARARENAIVAGACAAVIDAPAPEGTGGSVAPEAPAAGWTDVVYAARTGERLVALADGEHAPDGATVVRRQWRVRAEGGSRVFEVSAELAGPEGGDHPRAGETLRALRRALP